MDLDESQRAAVRAGVEGLEAVGQTAKLNGPAGTGKTTIIREVMRSGAGGDAVVLAPTNKAAHVLRAKGIPAQTIHSALYQPRTVALRELKRALEEALHSTELDGDEQQRLLHELCDVDQAIDRSPNGERLQFSLQTPNTVTDHPVIVDEASMVGSKLYDDLRQSTGRGIVLVGDDAQLPPVRDEPVFHQMAPAATLDTVHRQDAGSPILEIAMAIRRGRQDIAKDVAKDSGCWRLPHEAPPRADALTGIEVVWRNKTRQERNALHREDAGRTHWLEAGDWLVSLRNRGPEFNGSFCRVLPVEEQEWDRVKCGREWKRAPVIRLDCDGEVIERPIAFGLDRRPAAPRWCVNPDCGWDYAYSVTCHKAQGSEWDSVTVYDEWGLKAVSQSEQYRPWLYTAITRAREELIWCSL